jgi:hypothetical protein
VARREEWREQVRLASLLDKWMDPSCAFWSATDPVAPSAMSGALRRARGVKPGVPDTLIWYRRKSIAIEMKSRSGRCSAAQRVAREGLIRAGAAWWVCRSARSAMIALARSGVKFRTIVHADGTTERWRAPRVPLWEQPRRDPAERRPNAPEVVAERREIYRRWRERKRARALEAAVRKFAGEGEGAKRA